MLKIICTWKIQLKPQDVIPSLLEWLKLKKKKHYWSEQANEGESAKTEGINCIKIRLTMTNKTNRTIRMRTVMDCWRLWHWTHGPLSQSSCVRIVGVAVIVQHDR